MYVSNFIVGLLLFVIVFGGIFIILKYKVERLEILVIEIIKMVNENVLVLNNLWI